MKNKLLQKLKNKLSEKKIELSRKKTKLSPLSFGHTPGHHLLICGMNSPCLPFSQREEKKAFTLVELIVVITILAILGTIAFVSFQNYTIYARDVVRASDLNNIKSVLEYSYTETGRYPIPDGGVPMTFSGATVWTQGTFGKDARRATKRLNEIPTDPLTNNEYTYSVLNTNSEFELGAVFEGDEISLNNTQQNTLGTEMYAAGEDFKAYVIGNYNGQLSKTSTGGTDYVLALPSIMNSDITTTRLEDIVSQKKLVIRGYENIPHSYGIINPDTSTLNFVNESDLVVYSGLLTDLQNTQSERITLLENTQKAYSGTLLQDSSGLQSITEIIIDMVDPTIEVIAKSDQIVIYVLKLELKEERTWSNVDPNCELSDIIIGEQIWAGCNSTIGTGIEYNDGACLDYQGTTTGGSSCYGFKTVESNYNHTYGVDNIWGKLYSWYDSSSACGVGYSVPTDDEWQILEATLNGGENCTSFRTGWLCDGLGWKDNMVNDYTNNIVQGLKIPLSGYKYTGGVSFYYRGSSAYLWSSSGVSAYSYARHLDWNHIQINRLHRNKNDFLSVRCIKD